MLKRLLYHLSQTRIPLIRPLLLALAQEGVHCMPWPAKPALTGSETAAFPLPNGSRSLTNLLFLTDDPAMAKKMSAQGVACVGVSASDTFFEGTELVLEGFEDIDRRFLEEYLLRFHGQSVTIARTERLLLREIIPDDFASLYAISQQPGMAYALADQGKENSFHPTRLQAYIRQQYRLYGYGLWTVLKDQDIKARVIGCCGFSEFSCHDPQSDRLIFLKKDLLPTDSPECFAPPLELQYFLDETFQRQGLGTEMCLAALAYARDRLGAASVWVRVHPENPDALRFAVRLGFERR